MVRPWLVFVCAVAVPGCNEPVPSPQAPAPERTASRKLPALPDPATETVVLEEIAPREEHPFSVKDVLEFARLGVPVPNPDGSKVAFQVKRTDWSENRSRADIWLVDLETRQAHRLTQAAEDESDPCWSPDGRTLYFLGKGEEHVAIWSVPAAGGAASKIAELALDVANLRLSPDGKTLAFTAEVFPDCETLGCTAERLHARASSRATGRTYDRLFVRHWDSWEDGRRSHLFAMGVDGENPTDLTRGLDGDVPSQPFGGRDEYVFTPDGLALVFAARVAGDSEPWSTNFDLHRVALQGGELQNLTADNLAWDTQPTFSPAGDALAYLAMSRPGFEADRLRLMLRSWPDGGPREVAADWDRSIEELVFSADGRQVFVTAADRGQQGLFAITLDTGAVEPMVTDGTVSGLARAGTRLVFRKNDLRHPDELFTVDTDGSNLRPLTELNERPLALSQRGEAEQFSFKGAKGDTVYGYVVKPVGFAEDKSYPVAFLIHGGPQGSFGNRFQQRWNPQTYAGAGYAAVMIDFHGSEGYGQRFTDAVSGDWGGAPLDDLKKGLEAALARYPWLDGDRVCALGASYGGYMINWIAGKLPDRFRCLVNHDGVFDMRSMYYSTEELWFPEWEHGGPYYQATRQHELHNPVALVDKWKTPMLVIHGEQDFRVPPEQGLAAFTALQRRGIPSQLLFFPDENHWVLKPANSVQWHETVLAWLDRWLRTEPPADADAGEDEVEIEDDAAPQGEESPEAKTPPADAGSNPDPK